MPLINETDLGTRIPTDLRNDLREVVTQDRDVMWKYVCTEVRFEKSCLEKNRRSQMYVLLVLPTKS